MSKIIYVLAILVSNIAILNAEDKFEVAQKKAGFAKDIDQKISNVLTEEALQITLNSKAYFTIWLRKSLPTNASETQIKNGLTYREIPEGTFVGVMQIHQEFIDFRKQTVEPGIYSMRIAVQPETGDHMDTAPHADFLLLVPIKLEKNTDAIEVKKLVQLSMNITDGDHPSVMLLYPNYGKPDKAAIASEKNHVSVIKFHLPVVADDGETKLGFSLAIKGFSESRKD